MVSCVEVVETEAINPLYCKFVLPVSKEFADFYKIERSGEMMVGCSRFFVFD